MFDEEDLFNLYIDHLKHFHPYRPVWYVPDKGIMDYTILDT